MAAVVAALSSSSQGFQGLGSLFEYTNEDGNHPNRNCGQAAAATMLTYRGRFACPATPDAANHIMTELEDKYGADILFGLFGTSRHRMTEMIAAYGGTVSVIQGVAALKRQVELKCPVIVMLDIARDKAGWNTSVGGHWTVVFAYDKEYVYLTNWPDVNSRCAWKQFRLGWTSWLPSMIAMRATGLVVPGAVATNCAGKQGS
jgi:hypothetical protein